MPTIQQLQDQIKQNSAAWHGASKEEQNRLHEENKRLQSQIDSMTGGSSSFNSSTGKWTNNAGGYTPPGGGYTPPSSGGTSQNGGYANPGYGGYTQGGGYTPPSISNGYGSRYGTDANGNQDYSVMIRDAINSGADAGYVNSLLNQRMQKAQQSGMYQYVNDDVAKMANEYINNKRYEPNNLYKNMIEQMYSSASDQQEAAQRAAIEQAVNDLSGQKTGIVQSYDDLYKQLYLERRRAEKNLPQQLAAMGISGGMSESSALGIQNSYANALAQGEQEKLNTLNDIDQAIANARLTGEIGIAQQAAQLAMDKLNAYGSYVNGLMNQQNYYNDFLYRQGRDQVADNRWQQDWDRQQILDQLSRDDVSYDRKLYMAEILYQNTGDASGFKALGMTDDQIAAMGRNWYAQAMSSGGSGGSGSSGGYKPVLTYSQVMDAIDRGNPKPQVLKDYQYYMGAEYEPEEDETPDGYTPSEAVQRQIKSLESMRGQSGSETAIANSIVALGTMGKITMDDAEYMLRYFGYNPRDYIEYD